MGTPHKHRDVIIAWANGAEIEYKEEGVWYLLPPLVPPYFEEAEYRIKPKRVKKEGWLNLYSAYPAIHATKEEADFHAESTRKACVRIEWEEDL